MPRTPISSPTLRPWWAKKRIWIPGSMLLVSLGAALAIWAVYGAAFGAKSGDRDIARLSGSAQWSSESRVFENSEPMWTNTSIMATIRAYQEQSEWVTPTDPASQIPQGQPHAKDFAPKDQSVQVTWFGHSSMYLQVDGHRFLIDPVWGPSSPIPWFGFGARWFAPTVDLEDLPVPDAVVISHDHYDHLDYQSITTIKDWETTFVVPLAVGDHLRMWGVPDSRIVELDWSQSHRFGDLELVCLPARHASGRGVFDQNATLWAGWGFLGNTHRVYYSGDTGLFDGMKQIGEQYGPFDLAMIEVGQYHPNWPDWHLGPEQAVLAAQWVKAKKLLPVHWGAFTLAMHSWTAPVERTLIAAKEAGVPLITPKPSEVVDLQSATFERWWTPDIPFLDANAQPVVANLANGRGPHQEK